MASASRFVPGGPYSSSGRVFRPNCQEVSKRSGSPAVWSEWRWLRKTACSPSYFSPAAAMRIVAPRPASTTYQRSPATIAHDGPARFGSGRG